MSKDLNASICSTNYMERTLKYFVKKEMMDWYEEIRKIDKIISEDIESNYALIAKNKTKLTVELINILNKKIINAGIVTEYDLSNIEVFHGYIYYVYPDNGLKIKITGNEDINYGIAKSMVQGLPHRHFKSDSFNYILDGEGVFTGDPMEKGMFDHYYHGKSLIKDTEIEIPIGMTHGHLVKKDSVLWFMAIQECSFAPNKGCAGDFHKLPEYDKSIFGQDYH